MMNNSKKINIESVFSTPGNWYKANLHTHTSNSDGLLSPAETIEKYKKSGHDILAITDHNFFTMVNSPDILLIPGAEYHPLNKKNTVSEKHHLVCLNIKKGLSDEVENISAQDLINNVIGQEGFVVAGHPYWLKQDISDLKNLKGISAIEVYNATCSGVGRELSEQIWDDYCIRVKPVYGIACDDCHFKNPARDFNKGWVWVKTKTLTLAHVMEALKKGMFYSSTGPEIKDVKVTENNEGILEVFIQSSPAKSIALLAAYGGGQLSGANGKLLESGVFYIRKDNPFFRIEVRAGYAQTAWSNPIILQD
jgi:hypothetical protein